jgi:hypothetical protein
VIASYSEDQLITSDPRQILETEQAKREFARSLEGEEASTSSTDSAAPPREIVKGLSDMNI